jgi:hypothetical protein
VLFSVVFLKITNRMASTASLNIAAIITALFVAILPLIIISTSGPLGIAFSLALPIAVYLITTGMTAIYQYSKCNKIDIKAAFFTNLMVLASALMTTGILFLEQIPFLKIMYPDGYAPRNPVSGLPYSPETAEYIEGMKNENHYKLQLFTSIVKAVIPVYVNDNTKLGIVYFYWFFFMTLLPLYFILTVQGNCK